MLFVRWQKNVIALPVNHHIGKVWQSLLLNQILNVKCILKMKDYTKANQKKSNFEINTKKVSLRQIFEGLPKPKKMKFDFSDLVDKFESMQEEITNTQTIEQRIMEALYLLSPSKQLKTLEKLSMKIRKENSIRINKDVEITKRKYPKT